MALLERTILLVFLLSVVDARRPPSGVSVEKMEIWSEIQSRFAVTDVLATMSNTGVYDQEVKFSMDIPDRAFISQFHMLIDGRRIDADVRRRDVARDAYEKARQNNQNAGLVEQSEARSTSTFEISTNLAPRSSVSFNLTYQEVLQRVQGVYKHVINVRPEYDVDELAINVLVVERERISRLHTPKFAKNAGQMTNKQLLQIAEDPAVKSQSMSENGGSLAYVYYDGSSWGRSPDGQMVILYDVERSSDGGQLETLDGYFVHFIAPDGMDPGERDVIFAIDTSGSMAGRKLEQVKSALKKVVDDLHAGDRFDILTFANDVKLWKGRLVDATYSSKREATSFIDNMVANGGTNMNDALVRSLQELNAATGRQPLASMVILLSDGLPTVGETDQNRILRNVRAVNQRDIVVAHCIAFGKDADYELLKRTASEHGGVARRIYVDSDADIQLEGFYDEISSPILTDVDVKYLPGDVRPDSLTIVNQQQALNDGSEIIVVGATNKQPYQNMQADVTGIAAGGVKKDLKAQSFKNGHPTSPCFVRPQMSTKVPDARHINFCQSAQVDPGLDLSRFRGKRQAPVTTAIGYIERMWAYLTIDRLIEESKDFTIPASERNQKESEALGMSLKYEFVTPLTSLVVVDNGQDDSNININRFADLPTVTSSSNRVQPLDDPDGSLLSAQTSFASPQSTFQQMSAAPEVNCHDMRVTFIFDTSITGDRSSRVETAKRLARDAVNRLRRALPYGNETQFMLASMDGRRSSVELTHKFDDDQSSDAIIEAIDGTLDGQISGKTISAFSLLRELTRGTSNRMLLFTDGSKPLNTGGRRLGMMRRSPYNTEVGVVAIHYEEFDADRQSEYLDDLVGTSNEKNIFENKFAANVFDDLLSC